MSEPNYYQLIVKLSDKSTRNMQNIESCKYELFNAQIVKREQCDSVILLLFSRASLTPEVFSHSFPSNAVLSAELMPISKERLLARDKKELTKQRKNKKK